MEICPAFLYISVINAMSKGILVRKGIFAVFTFLSQSFAEGNQCRNPSRNRDRNNNGMLFTGLLTTV